MIARHESVVWFTINGSTRQISCIMHYIGYTMPDKSLHGIRDIVELSFLLSFLPTFLPSSLPLSLHSVLPSFFPSYIIPSFIPSFLSSFLSLYRSVLNSFLHFVFSSFLLTFFLHQLALHYLILALNYISNFILSEVDV